jgi:hypothetical protein
MVTCRRLRGLLRASNYAKNISVYPHL